MAADPPVSTVVELHLTANLPGLSPTTIVILDLDLGVDDSPAVFPLTLGQAHELHAALEKVLAAA